MSKAEFIDWKTSLITQKIFQELQSRVTDMTDYLSENAGKDPSQDRELVGAIKAYRDMINIEYFEESQT
jgi:hypothetical protein